MTFQSTLPLRGATYSYWISPSVQIFQSTLPLRGATIGGFQHFVPAEISIHTPLAGSDLLHAPCPAHRKYFNPHSPCGERRRTSSASASCSDFNPHSPCGERPDRLSALEATVAISIHTPLAGSDFTSMRLLGNRKNDFNPHSPCGERLRFSTKTIGRNYFNPHSPCGERPGDCAEQFIELVISIHTPLAGSDLLQILVAFG